MSFTVQLPAIILITLPLFSLPLATAQDRQRPTESEIADSAIQGFLRATDSSFKDARISNAREVVLRRAAAKPSAISDATIIFNTGLDTALLGELLDLSMVLACYAPK